MYIYPEQQGMKPYWASQGDGVGANYYNPTKALRMQYQNVGKRGGSLPNGRSFILADLPSQPGDLDMMKYNVNYAGSPTPRSYPYPWQSGIPSGPLPETRFVPPSGPEYHYSSGFDKLSKFFSDLWMSIKIAFLKFMAKLGLYKGMIPTNPNSLPPVTAVTQPTAYQPVAQGDVNGPYTEGAGFYPTGAVKFNSPFENHTTIFSREVIP